MFKKISLGCFPLGDPDLVRELIRAACGSDAPTGSVRGIQVPRPHQTEGDANALRDMIRRLYTEAAELADPVDDEPARIPPAKIPFPKISRVIFNNPATKVYFNDGTSVLVKASKDDKFSKEAGIAYAIVKRLMGIPGKNGVVDSNGYMEELKRIVDGAFDQEATEAKKAKKPVPPPAPKDPTRKKTAKKTSRKKKS